MQDPLTAAFQGVNPQFPEPEQQQQQQQLKCPRCDSTNTKFCYYNNYNLSQPRHFCKNCRRYWTKGGALRNIPIGGGSRKNSKRSSSSSSKRPSSSSSSSLTHPSDSTQIPKPEPISAVFPPVEPDDSMLEITGSFSSLLQSTAHFGNLLEGFQSGGSTAPAAPDSSDPNRSMGGASNDSSGSENPPPLPENFLDTSCWTGGWPDLAIYTPGSSFQ